PTHLLNVHSFPTRRSSDLSRLSQISSKATANSRTSLVLNTPQFLCCGAATSLTSKRMLWVCAVTLTVVMPAPLGNVTVLIAGRVDRKSTRLNSSHLGISYA